MTWNLGVRLALTLGCLATSATVSANDQELIDGVLSQWSGPKGLDTIRHLATCTTERFPKEARAFVRIVGDDAYFMKNQATLFNDKCLKTYWFKNSVTAMSSYVYLPVLAENLLIKDYRPTDLPDITAVGALDHPVLPPVDAENIHPRYRDMFAIDRMTDTLERTAECVARTAPESVFKLAQSAPSSANEALQLTALQEAISNCGGEKVNVVFPAFAWRGSLVKNLYRLVDAARPVTGGGVKPNA